MPIRTVPWDELTLAHVQALIDREIPENRTLEYKETLTLDDSGRVDFLQDVTAMANAAGGTLIYGAVEGEGEDRGLIIRYQGMPIDPEKVGLQLNNLLQMGVDERIHNVLHRSIPVGDGTHLYVVRIPASPRAPHMVTVKSSRPRFYSRATISNDPMNMQQIRDSVLRSDTVVERAGRLIEARAAAALTFASARRTNEEPRDDSIALVHVLPLYQSGTRVDLAGSATAARMKDVRGYGTPYEGNLRWTLEGLYNQYESDGVTRRHWALLDREGALEFGQVGILSFGARSSDSGRRFLDIRSLDQDVRACVEQAQALSEAGWFTAPFVLSFLLLNVQGAMLSNHRNVAFAGGRAFPADHIVVEPEVVMDWSGGLDEALRRVFDTVWQAFGNQRSFLYNEDGSRIVAP